jgi:hypothetical protein
MHYQKKNSRSLAPYLKQFRTDSEGRFELGSLLQEYPPNLHLLLEPKHLLDLPDSWRRGLHPIGLGAISLSENMGTDKPVDIMLADLCPVELTVRTPQGIPAVLARVRLGQLNKQPGARPADTHMRTDRRGRIRLLLPAAAKLGLAIDSGDAFLLTCLETHAVAGDRSVARLDIKLPIPVAIRGRVVDGDDKGVEGASVVVHAQWDGRMPAVDSGVDEEAELPADRNGVRLAGFGKLQNPHSLFHALIGRRNVKTGGDGHFTLAVPRVGMRYNLNAALKVDGAWRLANARVVVDPKDGVEDIELVLR